MSKDEKRILVKGYMRPDKTSYYVVIPKPIRENLGLVGGEYFILSLKDEKQEIKLKLVEISEE
jgi:AbrB family looped-hinge helix DNA binding protein